MKLKQNVNNQVDLNEIIENLKLQYKNLYLFQFEDQVFIYRSIGRKEYKDIVLNENLTDQEKEEVECSLCTLWPKNFDFANCEEAGLPTQLADQIEKNSYLSEQNREKVLAYYRNEMFDLDNQINCMIIAAFPNLTLEEIENWDVATASKYLSRSEWILKNIKGVPFKQKSPESGYVSKKTFKTEDLSQTEQMPDDIIKSTSGDKEVSHDGKPKNRKQLSPQEIAELQAKYPGIDWSHDSGNLGMEGFKQGTVDTTPVALRPMKEVNKLKKKPPVAKPPMLDEIIKRDQEKKNKEDKK